MTRAQFEGGWKLLVPVWPACADEAMRQVYVGVVGYMDLETWQHVVKRTIAEQTYFPKPAEMLEYANEFEQRRGQAKADRWLEVPKNGLKVGDPEHPRKEGESLCDYIQRLSVELGYMAEDGRKVHEGSREDGARLPYRDSGDAA